MLNPNKNAISITNVAGPSMLPVSVPEESSQFHKIPSDMERVELSRAVSPIQGICDRVQKPLILLENVLEIHSHNETKYYCELCDAPCRLSSIMPHILGYKHTLQCLKQIAPYLYNEVKTYDSRKAESVYLRELIYHKKKYGSGKVRVFHDRPKSDPVSPGSNTSPEDQPGPSWRYAIYCVPVGMN
ncbi:uncharacterized protein NPIL_600231 [Nephila pilipes]|uniref:Uncharacterized protein n=1 Tax=Nephila pilipes TaxID=299642 RepID=A0A8X6PTA8_NEPPI|nr:uncharacterized protein NPIL_600231 [Nephila pilipes]